MGKIGTEEESVEGERDEGEAEEIMEPEALALTVPHHGRARIVPASAAARSQRRPMATLPRGGRVSACEGQHDALSSCWTCILKSVRGAGGRTPACRSRRGGGVSRRKEGEMADT
jgi:hypothetical protein